MEVSVYFSSGIPPDWQVLGERRREMLTTGPRFLLVTCLPPSFLPGPMEQ